MQLIQDIVEFIRRKKLTKFKDLSIHTMNPYPNHFLPFCPRKERNDLMEQQVNTRVSCGKPSRWWTNDKSLGPRGLLPLWFQVRTLWLLI